MMTAVGVGLVVMRVLLDAYRLMKIERGSTILLSMSQCAFHAENANEHALKSRLHISLYQKQWKPRMQQGVMTGKPALRAASSGYLLQK